MSESLLSAVRQKRKQQKPSEQATEAFLNLSEKMLVENFSKLNEDGQEEAVRQVEMLTKIPEYQRKNDDSEQD